MLIVIYICGGGNDHHFQYQVGDVGNQRRPYFIRVANAAVEGFDVFARNVGPGRMLSVSPGSTLEPAARSEATSSPRSTAAETASSA